MDAMCERFASVVGAMLAREELLVAYDAQLRARVPDRLPPGVEVEHDGPLVRLLGLRSGGFVGYRDLAGLDGPELDALIARQVRAFAERGERFEWKLHDHDRPSDLPDRLRAAGLVPEGAETVMIGPTDAVGGPLTLDRELVVREVVERADLDRIAELEAAVWGEGDGNWLADALEAERGVDPQGLTIVVVEAGSEVICAGWVRFEGGSEFATLWGGATLPAWRGRGIYRATVAYRAALATERGFRLIEVDASADSRPILERLGLVAVTTTTPYVWSPPSVPAVMA
jgi:GNAT superfamily N-acetyltransferase